MEDIEKHRASLKEGMKVILYSPGDFEVQGTLTFDKIWLGIPDLTTIRYENSKE